MTRRSSRRIWLILAGIFVVALALRIVAVLLFGRPDVLRSTESGVVAANLVAGNGFTFDLYGTRTSQPLQSFVPPLFPYLIALCIHFFSQPARPLELVHGLLSSLTAIMLYFIGSKLSGRRLVGLLAAAAAAVYPVFILMSGSPASYTLDAFFLALLVWASLGLKDRPTPQRAALAGVVLGLALLARPMLIGFLPILLIWLWLVVPGAHSRLLLLGTIITACMLLVLLPWTVRNYRVHRQFVFVATNGGFTLWSGNNPFTTGSGLEVYSRQVDAFLGVDHKVDEPEIIDIRPYPVPAEVQPSVATVDEIQLDRMLYRAGLAFVREHPDRGLGLALVRLQGFWGFRPNLGSIYEASWTRYYKILYVGLVCLFVPGLLLSFRKWRDYALLYMLFAYYTVFYVAFTVLSRFRWEIEPYFLIFAALAVCWLLDRLPLPNRERAQHSISPAGERS